MGSKSALTAALNDPDTPVADFALSSRRLPSAQVEDVRGTLEIANLSLSLSAASNYLSTTPSSMKAGSFVKVRARHSVHSAQGPTAQNGGGRMLLEQSACVLMRRQCIATPAVAVPHQVLSHLAPTVWLTTHRSRLQPISNSMVAPSPTFSTLNKLHKVCPRDGWPGGATAALAAPLACICCCTPPRCGERQLGAQACSAHRSEALNDSWQHSI